MFDPGLFNELLPVVHLLTDVVVASVMDEPVVPHFHHLILQFMLTLLQNLSVLQSLNVSSLLIHLIQPWVMEFQVAQEVQTLTQDEVTIWILPFHLLLFHLLSYQIVLSLQVVLVLLFWTRFHIRRDCVLTNLRIRFKIVTIVII